MDNGAKWTNQHTKSSSDGHLFVYGKSLEVELGGRTLIQMNDVKIDGADGNIDYNVATEEEAIALVKSKTASNEYAYEWDRASSRLIAKPPSATAASGGSWSRPYDGRKHLLFMYADQQVTFASGDSLVTNFGEDPANSKITLASLGILGVASLIMSI